MKDLTDKYQVGQWYPGHKPRYKDSIKKQQSKTPEKSGAGKLDSSRLSAKLLIYGYVNGT